MSTEGNNFSKQLLFLLSFDQINIAMKSTWKYLNPSFPKTKRTVHVKAFYRILYVCHSNAVHAVCELTWTGQELGSACLARTSSASNYPDVRQWFTVLLFLCISTPLNSAIHLDLHFVSTSWRLQTPVFVFMGTSSLTSQQKPVVLTHTCACPTCQK